MVDDFGDGSSGITDAEAAFLVLSHDLRLEILLALWEAPGFSLSFSELRNDVGERDSGKFSYHLSELQGHFVAETDDGYELQYPGHRVLDAIRSGVFHDRAAVGPVELDADCRTCGELLTFEYDTDYIARVHCPDCGNRALEWPFDPGGIAERSPDEIIEAFDRRTRHLWSCALDSVCPFCAGRIEREFRHRETEAESPAAELDHMYDREAIFEEQPVFISVDCDQCSFFSFVPVGIVLLSRSVASGTFHETTLDVRDTPLWDLGFVVDPDAVSVRATDPTRVEVSVVDADEPLVFVIDESFEVTAEAPS